MPDRPLPAMRSTPASTAAPFADWGRQRRHQLGTIRKDPIPARKAPTPTDVHHPS
jgi:hypothetical protein